MASWIWPDLHVNMIEGSFSSLTQPPGLIVRAQLHSVCLLLCSHQAALEALRPCGWTQGHCVLWNDKRFVLWM